MQASSAVRVAELCKLSTGVPARARDRLGGRRRLLLGAVLGRRGRRPPPPRPRAGGPAGPPRAQRLRARAAGHAARPGAGPAAQVHASALQ